MTAMVVTFDDELWRWSLRSDQPVGPAGLDSLELADGVILHVDAFDATPVLVTVDADSSRGRLSRMAQEIVELCFGAPLRTDEELTIRPDVEAPLARLALLEGCVAAREGVGTVSPWWTVDAASLRRAVGLPQVDFRDTRGDDPPLDASVALAAFRAEPHHLGRLGEHGPVALDSSFAGAGLLDLTSARADLDRAAGILTVSVPIRSQVYAAEVEAVHVVLVERQSDLIVALSPFGLGSTGHGGPGALCDLVVSGRRDLDQLEIAIVEEVSELPSSRLRRRRAATHLARSAARAMRLGGVDDARVLLSESVASWRASGDTARALPVDPSAARSEPFHGEVADLLHDMRRRGA